MAIHDVVVIGTSSGGVEALARLASGLPAGLPAAIFVVCHFPPEGKSVLPDILSRSGPLFAQHACDGDPFYPGQIYVAPPGFHLLLQPGRLQLLQGPRENNHRPAIDPLFRSSARVFGSRVIGVVLTGGSNDGVAGLMAIQAAGGLTVVQDPRDAAVAAMPQSATDVAGADYIVPVDGLAALLTELVRRPVIEVGRPTGQEAHDRMPEIVEQQMAEQIRGQRGGQLSTFTCPECGGNLWQLPAQEPLRFRCHVGHSYSAESLLEGQTSSLEAALWISIRTFREKTVLARQLAHRERERGRVEASRRFAEQAEVSERYGELIRRYLLHGLSPNTMRSNELRPAADNRPEVPDPSEPLPPPQADEEAGD